MELTDGARLLVERRERRGAAHARVGRARVGWPGPSVSGPTAASMCFFIFHFFKSTWCLNLYRKLCADPKIVEIFV